MAAEQGNAVAQCFLGAIIDYGRGVPQSDNEAAHWYTKAAAQGQAMAQYRLGEYHLLGRGSVTQSEVEAARWYRNDL
jgi:hypothetical protein